PVLDGGLNGDRCGHRRIDRGFGDLFDVAAPLLTGFGEELGFLGVSLVLMLFVIVFFRGLKISSRHPGSFPYFLGHGLTFFIIYQTLINVAVVTGLIPTKGLPLPFVSYGGSSLLANMAAVGILLGLSKGYGSELAPQDQHRNVLRRKKARMAMHEEYMKRRKTCG
ncbi:MAG: FtsW/RodA/SpoVE family cell cycle protein, partial [Thermodesulfovibrionales bacterium]